MRACVLSALQPLPDFAFVMRVHGGAGRAAEVFRELLGVGEGADDPETRGAVRIGDEAFVGALGCADGAPDLGAGKKGSWGHCGGPRLLDWPPCDSGNLGSQEQAG